MKKAIAITAAVLALAACGTAPKPYDEQFVTARDSKGKPTAWVITPARTLMWGGKL